MLNRPFQITEPSGRVTTYTYTDSVPQVLESVQLDAAGNTRKTELTFDKFGRTITIRNLDPDGDVFRNIVYDGKGRGKQVSEPYRTGSPLWTTTAYNALDRPIQITNPDSTYRQYIYIGNVVWQ